MAENEKEKKIIIDEDWKSQAKKDKEELESKEKQQSQPEESQTGERPPLPEVDFAGLLSMFATQAYLALGLIATDPNEKPEPDLPLAKFNIDMLNLLEEKTKGNLTDEEEKMLSGTLHQLRMVYVQLSK